MGSKDEGRLEERLYSVRFAGPNREENLGYEIRYVNGIDLSLYKGKSIKEIPEWVVDKILADLANS